MKYNKKLKEAYLEILKVCEKHQDIGKDNHAFSDIRDMIHSAKNHLLLIEWEEQFGLIIPHDKKPYSIHHVSIHSDYTSLSYFNDAMKDKDNNKGKFISWSDDGQQPQNEWLFRIGFSTGAYIFGDDYDGQQNLFQDFFNELKTYNPDFSDTHNSVLYWKIENAKEIFDEFINIVKKYQERNKSEFNKRKADKLRKELEQLEKEEQ